MKALIFKTSRTLFAIALSAFLCGCGGWLFLAGLEWVTCMRIDNPDWFLVAPLVGLITGWVFSRLYPSAAHGSVLLVTLARQPENECDLRIPRLLVPLIVVFTWLSHLAGLSVGREGTAIQIGGGLAALSGRLVGVNDDKSNRLILLAGMASGFGAVFHVPWAAAVFALEIAHAGFFFGVPRDRLKNSEARLPAREVPRAFVICICSSLMADACATALGAHHLSFPLYRLESVASFSGMLGLVAGGVGFGLVAWCFLFTLREFKKRWASLVKKDWLRPAIGGLIFGPMAIAPSSLLRYCGLGGYEIKAALDSAPPAWDWLLKLAFTVFGLGTGFKGGEVTPLFFMGASSGAALAQFFGLEPASLASLGLVAVFGAAAGLPITCAVMAAELFGPAALIAALPVCLIANQVCCHSKLYDMKTEL